MKKLGFALLGLVVFLIAAVLIVPSFVDWNTQKGRITAEVRNLTGRALTIGGDVSLALLPAPTLSVDKVRLANIEGGSAPFMIELESLEVRIALVPLLQGQVRVESVSLVRPKILVEVLPDGRKNWEIMNADAPGPAGPPESGAGGGLSDQVRLDSVLISDGTLIYRDARANRDERITDLNAEIAAGSLNGPFAVSGDAAVRGIKTEFKVTLGQLVRGGATSLSLGVVLPDAGAKARFNGAVSLHPEGASLRGRIKAEGEKLSSLITLLSGGGQTSAVLAQPFSVETGLSADPQQITAADLMFHLGETSMEGDLRVKLGPPLDARINISASRLDLDKIMAASAPGPAGEGGTAPASGGGAGEDAAPDRTAAAFVLPKGVTGSLEAAVDALVYRGQVVRQLLVSATLAEGRLKVSQALALLPGGSDISLTGALGSADTAAGPELRFDGRIEAASDNLRGIFDWLGVDVTMVPAERLRRMSLSARVGATARQATLSEIDLRVDVSRATGGIAIALRERPGFGIGLAIDKLNLDAYLAPQGPRGEAAGAGAGAAPSGGRDASAPALLAGFDANLDLKLGSLALSGVTLREIRLDATLQRGAITLREAFVGDAAGVRARVAGRVSGLTVTSSMDLDVELTVPDPARVAKLANLDAGILAKVGAFTLAGKITGTPERVGFDAKLDALGGRFGFAGTAKPLAAPPGFDLHVAAKHPRFTELLRAFDAGPRLGPQLGGLNLSAGVSGTPINVRIADLSGTLGPARFTGGFAADLSGPVPVLSGIDLAIEVQHPDLAGLVSALAPDTRLGKGLGGVDVEVRVTGGSDKIQAADLSGTLGPARLAGGFAADLSGPAPVLSGVDLAIEVQHPDLAGLVRAAAPDTRLGKGLGGVDLNGRVTGGENIFRISELAGRLGKTDLSGSLGVDLSGPKPMIDVDLSTGELPLAAFMAPAGGKSGGAASAGNASPAAAGGKSAGDGRRWSSEPIDVSALHQVNAVIKLKSKALLLDKLRLDNALIEASLADGLLDLREMHATVYDGALSIAGKIDARKTLEVGLSITAIELNLARLLHDLGTSGRVSGPLSVNASLSARGRSEAELVAALAGKGDVSGTLKVSVKEEEKVGALLLGILGQRIREIRGVTDATNLLINAFADAPAAVQGTFTVEQGVVRTNDLRVEGRQASAVTQGTADLPAWRLNTKTDVYRVQDPATAFLTVDLRGPLDAPNPRVRGQPFQPRQQTGPVPSAGPQPSAAGRTQPASREARPEDILKEGLQKTLKGLFGN